MEASLKIQMDVKNNVQDLQNYVLDLNHWEKEMKKKEMDLQKQKPSEREIPLPRNKIKRSQSGPEKSSLCKTKKISAYDYSAWDKYDVDKAIAELENDNQDPDEVIEEPATINNENNGTLEEESDSENEDKLSLIDKAFYEKELGNQFVKKEEWNNAIRCYTNAINLDSKNPIYYSNRSLCFFKLKNFRSAEVDATVALQLDKNYVKAYQRRAVARLSLGQLAEAKADYEEVLKLEPKNSFAKLEIDKITVKLSAISKIDMAPSKATFNHKNLFKNEEKPKKSVTTAPAKPKIIKSKDSVVKPFEKTSKKESKNVIIKNEDKKEEQCPLSKDFEKVSSTFQKLPPHCRIVHPVQIPPHKRSKVPLRRIKIDVVDEDTNFEYLTSSTDTSQNTNQNLSKKNEEKLMVVNKYEDVPDIKNLVLSIPKTSIQFQNTWKIIKKNPQEAYKYLMKIPGEKLPEIFENSLESDFFSDLIIFLANSEIEKNPESVYSFLLSLTTVKRFSSLVLFMSKEDKECVKKCMYKAKDIKSEQEITLLQKLYEL